MSDSRDFFPVVIVGAGPVGVTTATIASAVRRRLPGP